MFTILEKYNFWHDQEIPTGYIRNHYLSQLQQYLGSKLVKVILGQRRVGKSYLMRMIISNLIHTQKVSSHNILYINMDLQPFDFIRNQHDLMNVIEEYQKKLNPIGKIYIFIDEIQEIFEWEKVVNSLSQDYRQEYEIFITGSNANLLSKELGTYLSGRFVSFELFPFSYGEYLDFHQFSRNKDTFLDYLNVGGLPENYHLHNQEMRENYMQALRDSILLRDIVNRYHVRDANLLEKVANYMTQAIGSLFSLQSIVKYLKSHHYKTNVETIGNYLAHLENAYYLYSCERYDIKGKTIFSSEKKYYLNDLFFKNLLSSSFDRGIGHNIENIVFLDLKRQGYTVHVGYIRDKEVDFIAEKGNDRIYIQVCYLLSDENVIAREFNNLMQIPDNYPKYVLSLDDILIKNDQGIIHQNVWQFLS
jgi:predicted AAA+ superfamily ATPase